MTNGGVLKANRMGMYQDMKVWFNSNSIVNVLSFSSVAEKHRIVINTAKEKDILVEIEGGKWMRFIKNKLGLHDFNAKRGYSIYSNNDTSNMLSPYKLLHTVSNNEILLTRKERQLAKEAKDLSKHFRSPPIRKFFR